ncbi:signal peptidase II, partial [bacterium]|nr:signal peptidase II [bacterium]
MKSRLWPWALGFAGLLALDQWTKWLVRENFHLGESVALIGKDFLKLTYVQNPGIAFGLEPLSPSVLLVFGSVA